MPVPENAKGGALTRLIGARISDKRAESNHSAIVRVLPVAIRAARKRFAARDRAKRVATTRAAGTSAPVRHTLEVTFGHQYFYWPRTDQLVSQTIAYLQSESAERGIEIGLLVNYLLYDSIKAGASDIHIEPWESTLVVRIRLNGVLTELVHLPLELMDKISDPSRNRPRGAHPANRLRCRPR